MSVHGGPAKWWTRNYDAGRIHVASKGIIQSGLILNLDAGASTSYPGTGTVWYDLTGNGRNAVFAGSPLPTFTPTAGDGYTVFPVTGYTGSVAGAPAMTFSGFIGSFPGSTRNRMEVPAVIPITNNALTLSVWVKHRDTLPPVVQRYVTVGAETMVLRHQGSGGVGQFHFYGCTGRPGFSGSVTTPGYSGSSSSLKTAYVVNGAISTNTFYNFVGTWDGTKAIAYRNAVMIPPPSSGATTDTWGGILANSLATAELPFYVNCIISSADEPFNQGFVYSVHLYNRALTQTEIAKNYNVMRTRFGV